jgi:hypothetical protein
MKPHGPGHRSSGTTDAPSGRLTAAGGDFAWPPTAEDLDGCGIVSLCGDDDAAARLSVLVHLPDVLPPREERSPAATTHPVTPSRPAPRVRHWGVEQPGAAYPFHVDGDDPMAPASAGGEVRRAVVAVAAGLSLAFLSYLQFRSARADASALVSAVAEATSASLDRHGPDPVMEIPRVVVDRLAPPESVGRRLVARASALEAADVDAPVSTTLARLASGVIDEVRTPQPIAPPPVAAAPAAVPVAADVVDDTRPAPVPAADVERASPPAAVVVAAHVDPIAGEEDRVRAALTQWRAAYSALDARAAREVWPTVDARALERAFQALKSQDLRFDRCDLTVDGGSAVAACSGRATYVPRVGNQSPKAMPREWTFELKKRDQQWTIASARAS